MRIWFDTEFVDDGRTIELISIGLVREDDYYMYLENVEFDRYNAPPWIQENVIPRLKGGDSLFTRKEMAEAIRRFAGDFPEFWAYFAAYDWVALCQLYGPLMQIPPTWPKYCLDIKQSVHLAGNPSLQRPENDDHNALADARWNRKIWNSFHTPSRKAA